MSLQLDGFSSRGKTRPKAASQRARLSLTRLPAFRRSVSSISDAGLELDLEDVADRIESALDIWQIWQRSQRAQNGSKELSVELEHLMAQGTIFEPRRRWAPPRLSIRALCGSPPAAALWISRQPQLPSAVMIDCRDDPDVRL